MFTPRRPRTSRRNIFLLACACLLAAGTRTSLRAQTPPPQSSGAALSALTAHGIELYKQGELNGASKELRRATKQDGKDTVAWLFFGLTLKQTGDVKGAYKALGQAVRVSFARLASGYPLAAHKKYADLNEAERAAARQTLARYYQEAFDSVDGYLQVNPPNPDFWRAQRTELKFYATHLSEADTLSAGDVTQKAVITFNPEPLFTEEARRNNTNGEITLRMVLAADGTVQHILVLKALPDGLTEKAISAAHKIQFTPATKDGRPVSQIVTVSYNFNVY